MRQSFSIACSLLLHQFVYAQLDRACFYVTDLHGVKEEKQKMLTHHLPPKSFSWYFFMTYRIIIKSFNRTN